MTLSSHSIAAYVGETQLDVISASITLDESWSPYVQGTITCPIPENAILDTIDPRDRVHIRLYVQQVFGESETIAHLTTLFTGSTIASMTAAYTGKYLFELSALWFTPWNSFGVRASTRRDLYVSLRRRSIDHVSATMQLDFSSDEAYLQDYALTTPYAYAPGITSVRSAVIDALARIGGFLQAGTADGTIEANASTWNPGQSAWSYLEPLIQRAKLRLFCDEKGRFFLVNDTYVADGQTTLTYTGTITSATDDIDRDSRDYFDGVIIKYTWTDALGATQYAYDAATTGDYSKVVTLEYDTVYPGAGAAQQVLNRALSRGHVQGISAISDYSVSPSQSVMLTLPNTDTQTGFVKAVSWTYPDDEMRVDTRGLTETPSTAWIFTPAGVSWNSISAGISWNTYTYP